VPSLRDIPTRAWIVFAVIFLAGTGIRVYETVKPIARLSADAHSYAGIGKTLGNTGRYQANESKLRWPPGTPILFGAAYKLSPGEHSTTGDYDAPRWAQFLVTTGTILMVFLLGWLLAGPWAGVIASAIIAFYPPLYWGPSNLLSEPLGAFLVTCAFTALVAAWRSRKLWWFGISGALFGTVLLTRTDLLFVPVTVGLVVLVGMWRHGGWKQGVLSTALLGVCGLLVIAPWSIYASGVAGRVVPITIGGGSAFFVGTYLPGNGSTITLKHVLQPEIVKRYPQYKGVHYKKIPGKAALDTIAARHPEMSRDNALLTEARANLKDAVLHHPVQLAKLWWTKIQKMWFRASLGGAHHPMPVLRIYHNILVILTLIGLIGGIVRRRDPALISILVAVLTATAVHMFAVANGRYGLPVIPIFFTAGVAGWWMLVSEYLERRRSRVEEADEPATQDDAPADPPTRSILT